MKMETFNTILLIILVALSLVLTAYVWTFQPNSLKSDSIGTEEPKTLDGTEKQLADVVRPTHTYVHNGGSHFVFTSKDEEQVFVNGLADWTLTNTKSGSVTELPQTSIELVYPVTVAYSQLNALFQVEGAENVTNRLGNGGFTRLYLEPSKDGRTTKLTFVNERQENPLESVVTATATNSVYDFIHDEDKLNAAVSLSDTNEWNRIYLPETADVNDSIVRGETITRNDFADVYMEEKSVQGTDQYTDSNLLEMIKFRNNGQFASYQYNSTSSSVGTTSRTDQLQSAINAINTHKGWTDDYNLYAISGENNFTFQFRMISNGYPVFQTNDLSLISIRMQDNLPEPVSYERTLLNIGVAGGSQNEYQLTAQQVIDWINENKYSPRDIQDAIIGYRLEDNDDSAIYKYHLKPSWYVKYQGEWYEVGDSETGGES
ncbi:YycH family regulatory protein [Terribacillus sp. JSM ZJ617]|uniref:YycH family regulatory protein n=1 Tax=Terribacillus sp. JSM ZJ617 TaxID=3342119 RepID=UPI0035A977CD